MHTDFRGMIEQPRLEEISKDHPVQPVLGNGA